MVAKKSKVLKWVNMFVILVTLLLSLLPVSGTLASQEENKKKQVDSQTLPLVDSVSAGRDHTCVLTTGGKVKCWGDNYYGQLGDGTIGYNAGKLYPVNVVGLSSAVQAISAGENYTCALTTTGGVKCWGNNYYGQLGDGKNWTSSSSPVDVISLSSGVKSISAGYDHTCALTTGGAVKCWGYNDNGQLGDNTITARKSPVAVAGLSSGVASIAAGYKFACAVMVSGAVVCWGNNEYGQLGNGNNTDQKIPVYVSGLDGATNSATILGLGESHACAVLTTGAIKCWGKNSSGQLGNGNSTSSSTPVSVSGIISGATKVTGGRNFSCATVSSGEKCWGNNYDGQLGIFSNTFPYEYKTPQNVSSLESGASTIAAGAYHACGVTTSGELKCWGINDSGQLGTGSTSTEYGPVSIPLNPEAFNITSPANNSIQTGSVTLTWQASAGAVSYDYCFTEAVIGCAIWTNNDLNTSVVKELGVGKKYYWNVRAINSVGTVYANASDALYVIRTAASKSFSSNATRDGYVTESSAGSGKGKAINTSTTLIVGDDASDRQSRSILSFDTSSLPDNATVTSAIITLTLKSTTGGNPFSLFTPLLADIKKGFFGSRDSLEPGDFDAAASSASVGNFAIVSGQNNTYQLVLSSKGMGFINTKGLTQLRLKFKVASNKNHKADFASFYSGNEATAGKRPTLVIQYVLP